MYDHLESTIGTVNYFGILQGASGPNRAIRSGCSQSDQSQVNTRSQRDPRQRDTFKPIRLSESNHRRTPPITLLLPSDSAPTQRPVPTLPRLPSGMSSDRKIQSARASGATCASSPFKKPPSTSQCPSSSLAAGQPIAPPWSSRTSPTPRASATSSATKLLRPTVLPRRLPRPADPDLPLPSTLATTTWETRFSNRTQSQYRTPALRVS
jgi:hypothetical protein